ncbi:hypothetical protein D3C80_1438520 [compost metagenome]
MPFFREQRGGGRHLLTIVDKVQVKGAHQRLAAKGDRIVLAPCRFGCGGQAHKTSTVRGKVISWLLDQRPDQSGVDKDADKQSGPQQEVGLHQFRSHFLALLCLGHHVHSIFQRILRRGGCPPLYRGGRLNRVCHRLQEV